MASRTAIKSPEPAQFWLRKNWILSKVVRWTAGNIIITEGKYKNPKSKEGTPPSTFILIFSKMQDDGYDPALTLSQDTRLPQGLAIGAQHWEDFKRAFGRYLMFKDSRCKDEIDQFFSFTSADYKTDKLWYDIDRADRSNSPMCDDEKLEYSQKKANKIAEALADFPAFGAVDERMSESGSVRSVKTNHQDAKAGQSANDSDAATEIVSETEGSDADDFDAIEAAVRAQVLQVMMDKKSKNKKIKTTDGAKKRTYTDVLMASKKVSLK